MKWKSLLPWLGNREPLPSLDTSQDRGENSTVRYVEDRFILWKNQKGQLTKIDMSQCSAIGYAYDDLYVVVGGQKYYPPLTFEQADHYWDAARNNYYLPA